MERIVKRVINRCDNYAFDILSDRLVSVKTSYLPRLDK